MAQVTAGSPKTVAYLHTDHLGTPRFGTNTGGSSVWSWNNDAFGTAAPSGSRTVNLRMPGQYYDSESGLFYNWNRYYSSAIGRYVSSDPIGLEGGLNTFLYTKANPTNWIDIDGLAVLCMPGEIGVHCDMETEMGIPLGGYTYISGGKPGSGGGPILPKPTPTKKPQTCEPTGPHTLFKRDPITGEITHYETWIPQTNPLNPNPWQFEKAYDGRGRSHFNKKTQQYVDTPHVHDPKAPGGVRPAYPEEMPE